MTNIANELWNDFVSLVFPESCFACGRLLVKNESHLCTYCRYELPVSPSAADKSLRNKFVHEPAITYVKGFLPFKKFGLSQKILHQIKYKGNYELGVMLGTWFGDYLMADPDFPRFDCLCAVPLHPKKLRIRGYNQSEAIAQGLHTTSGIKLSHEIVRRSRFTSTQTRKRKIERWQNVEEIFVVSKPEDAEGKKILLIDDVLTTGSTLSSCASVLLKAGAKEIGIAALAYA